MAGGARRGQALGMGTDIDDGRGLGIGIGIGTRRGYLLLTRSPKAKPRIWTMARKWKRD